MNSRSFSFIEHFGLSIQASLIDVLFIFPFAVTLGIIEINIVISDLYLTFLFMDL